MTTERKCILSGEPKRKEDLVRYVLSPDGYIVPDIKGNLPGRGVWVTAKYADVKEAESKGLFSRAFKSSLMSQNDLAEKTRELLLDSALSWLSLANKSGSLVCGRAKVEKAMNKLKVVLLLEAVDASEDGKKKLRSLKNMLERETEHKCDMLALFTVEQMSLALGRENVVHAAITNRQMASKFFGVAKKLENYTGE